jgi:hypothetical protein
VSDWAPDGTFIMSGIHGSDPQASAESSYWVSPDGGKVKLLGEISSAEWQPSGGQKTATDLRLRHRWIRDGSSSIRLVGTLTAGDRPISGAPIVVGRIGSSLPTHRLGRTTTHRDGSFAIDLDIGSRRDWRVATAFYPGSQRDWSMTAFDTLRSAG